MEEPVFERTYKNSLFENDSGGITVVSHLSDMIHDIKITLDVSVPNFVISNSKLEVVMAPGGRCQELCPMIEKLNGQKIKHGFTQFVRDLFGASDGCPNVVNMLLTSVPLAINTSWMIALKHGESSDDVRKQQKSQMKNVCISSGFEEETS